MGVKSSRKKKYKELQSFEEYYQMGRRSKAARIKPIVTILTVISILTSVMFMCLPVYYRVMSIVCMLTFIAAFALYIKYNDVVSLVNRGEKQYFTNICAALLAPSFAMAIRSVLSFTFKDFKMFWIWTIALAALILIIFFMLTEAYKRYGAEIMIIVFAVLFFAPSAVAQANAVLDFSKPKVTQSTVQKKEFLKNVRLKSVGVAYSYSIEVAVSTGSVMEFDIPEEYYNSLSVGDKVDIYEKPGFLKIPYIAIKNSTYLSKWDMKFLTEGAEDNTNKIP